MPILVILEARGERERLMDAATKAVQLGGTAPGLLTRVLAPTPDGILLLHLWETQEARNVWRDDADHRAAVAASGLPELLTDTTSTELVTELIDIGTYESSTQPLVLDEARVELTD